LGRLSATGTQHGAHNDARRVTCVFALWSRKAQVPAALSDVSRFQTKPVSITHPNSQCAHGTTVTVALTSVDQDIDATKRLQTHAPQYAGADLHPSRRGPPANPWLLRMLELSSSTTPRLCCTSEYAATDNNHLILLVLSVHFGGPTLVEFRSRSYPPPHRRSRRHILQSHSDSDAEPSPSHHRIPESNDWADTLKRACEMLPSGLSNLEFLSAHCPSRTSQPVYWSKVF